MDLDFPAPHHGCAHLAQVLPGVLRAIGACCHRRLITTEHRAIPATSFRASSTRAVQYVVRLPSGAGTDILDFDFEATLLAEF